MESSSFFHLVVGIAVALVAATATATIRWRTDAPAAVVDRLPGQPPDDVRGMAGTSDAATTHSMQQLQTSLLPGELAGYTGWARPIYTLAPTFQVVEDTWSQHHKWTVKLKSGACDPDVKHQRTQFYARAYGPAILTGRTTSHENCVYEIKFDFADPGTYWVEIVVTFSHGQIPRYFPLRDKPDADYEGYYVPGFPRSLKVTSDHVTNAIGAADPERPCLIADMLVSDSQEEAGRWVFDYRPSYDAVNMDRSDKEIDLMGYMDGRNAAGAIFKYQHRTNCEPPSLPPATNHPTHVLFLGDSNFKIQSSYFHDAVKSENIQVRHVTTSGGLYAMATSVHAAVVQIAQEAEAAGAPFVIFFNSGLHDIYQLCSGKKAEERAEDEKLSGGEYACVYHYQELLADMAEYLVNLPNKPRVFFQTTTAAFPKWGNYGSVWPDDEGQPYTLSPDFIMQFNKIAVNHLASKFPDTVSIVDGFWTSYARPDDRFVDTKIDINKLFERELVHPGHQVQMAHLNLWMTVLSDVMSQQISDANSN